MKNKSFTLLESTVVLLITTLVIGGALTLSSLNRAYQKFNEERLSLIQDIKNLVNLSLKGGEVILDNGTSTVCGVGLLYSSSTKTITFIAYATVSTSTIINCYDIASSSSDEFNFTNKEPKLYLDKVFYYTTRSDYAFKRDLKYITNLNFSTDTNIENFNTTSIIFLSLTAEPIIFRDNSRIDNFKEFNIIMYFRDDATSTITIKNTGQVSIK